MLGIAWNFIYKVLILLWYSTTHKKKKINKYGILHTVHIDGSIDVETTNGENLEVITFYKLNKGTVYMVDKLSTLYSNKSRSDF